MDQVFGGCAQRAEKFTPVGDPQAQDDEVYKPSSPSKCDGYDQPSGYVNDNVDEVGSNLGNEWDAMWKESSSTYPNFPHTPIEMSNKEKGKRVMESDSYQSNKKARTESAKKIGGTVALSEKIDGMVQIISERNNSSREFQAAMVNMMNTMSAATPKYTVSDAISKLCCMSELDSKSDEFFYACSLIEDPQRKTIFLDFPDDRKRLDYIRFMHARHGGCN